MKYNCPHCGKRYDIRDDFLKSGSMKMRCRECKNVMVISTGESAPPPLVLPGREVPTAPREEVKSLAPSAGSESSLSEDLPVAARSAEEDLVQEFDLAPPPPSPTSTPQEADLPTPRPVTDLDDAFELVGGSGPSSGPDLPAPKAASPDLEDFELDPPTPKIAPSAKPRAPSAPVKPRVKLGAASSIKGTIAGMPSPVASEEARKKETMLGMPSPVVKPRPQPPAPAGAVDLPAPKPAISELADPFQEAALPGPQSRAVREEFELDPAPASSALPPAPKKMDRAEVEEFELPRKPSAPTEMGMPVVEKGPTPLPPVLATPITAPSAPASGSRAQVAGFGALDLEPKADQPAADEPFGGLELPGLKPHQPAADEPFGGLELPGLKADQPAADEPFGELDLPGLKPHQPATDEPFGELDLPGLKSDQPAADEPFGELDLPGLKPDQPATDEPFGGLDLPQVAPPEPGRARDVEAPLPGLRDLPTKRGGASTEADPFASLDLPPGSSDKREVQPPVKKGGDRRDIFAEITDETTSGAGRLPAVDAGGGVGDLASEPGAAQATGSAGGTSFGEISLADSPEGVELGEPEVDLPERKYRGGEAGDEDAALELDGLSSGQAAMRPSGASAASAAGKAVEEKPRSSMRSLLALLLLIALGGGGAALYYTGLYVDVYKFGSRLIGRDIDAMMAERAGILADVGGDLAGDNFEAYSAGVDRLQKSVRATDDNVVRAYAVYLAYALQIRFGSHETYDKIAEAELRKVSLGEDLGREQVLALNAKLIFDRKNEEAAISKLEGLNRTLGGKDADILALVGLAGLRMGDGEKALQSFGALAGVEKDSARAQFGMVRAMLMQGKAEDAEELLTTMLESHPEHMDSKILKAKLLLRKGTVDQAEVMLDGIAKVGEGKLGPSQLSTVNALLGQIYLGRQETTKALERFTEADKTDPNNVEALIGLGQIHLMRDEPGKALSRYKMASVVEPNNLDAVLGITRCQIDLAAFTEADALLKGLLQGHPEDYRVHHLIGRYTEALQDYDQASTAYLKAIELNPAHLQSYLDLASMYFEIDRVSDALELLGQAKEKLPPTANLYAAFGQGYIERDELDQALVEIEAALEADPGHVQAHFLKGVALYKLEKYTEAEEVLTWVAEKDSGFPGLVLQQGLLFEAMGQIQKAEKYYSEALAAHPDDPEIMVRTASIFIVSQKYEKAREILEKVLVDDPNNPEALYYLGRVELGEGQPVVALKLIKKAIRIQPNVAVYHLYAAFAQEANASYSEALEAVHKSIELNNDIALAYLLRGRLYVRMGTVKDGMADLLRALELKPSLKEAYAPLGKASESLRRWSDAVDWYVKAVEFDPEDGSIRTNLALVLYDHGGRQEALVHFKKAVELGREAEGHPKWYYTSLYYLGRAAEASGQKDEARKLYKEYLDTAPMQSIDREDVERRYEKLFD